MTPGSPMTQEEEAVTRISLEGIVAEISVQEKINSKLQRSYRIMAEIEHATVELPEREAYLIRARYIDCKSWEQIAG